MPNSKSSMDNYTCRRCPNIFLEDGPSLWKHIRQHVESPMVVLHRLTDADIKALRTQRKQPQRRGQYAIKCVHSFKVKGARKLKLTSKAVFEGSAWNDGDGADISSGSDSNPIYKENSTLKPGGWDTARAAVVVANNALRNVACEKELISCNQLEENAVFCDVCDERIADQTALDNHRLPMGHFKCRQPACVGMLFANPDELQMHAQNAHGNQQEQQHHTSSPQQQQQMCYTHRPQRAIRVQEGQRPMTEQNQVPRPSTSMVPQRSSKVMQQEQQPKFGHSLARPETEDQGDRLPLPLSHGLRNEAPPPTAIQPLIKGGKESLAKHICSFCDEAFITPDALNLHSQMHGRLAKPLLSCMICGVQYPTEEGLLLHRQTYHNEAIEATELAISVFDLNSPTTINRLNSVGVRKFLHLPQLLNHAGRNFGLPLLSIKDGRFPHLDFRALTSSRYLSLGPLQQLPE